MSTMGRRSYSVRLLGIAFACGAPVMAACSMDPATPADTADQTDDALSACSVSVTTNTYSGPDYWGTITFKNNGAAAMKSPSIAFKVPSGVTCDYNPSGWKHTQSGTTCTYSRTSSLTVNPGKSYTFNYSTDSNKSFAASAITVSDASCGGTTSSSSSSSSSGTTSGSSSSSSSGTTSSSSSSSSSSGSGGMTSLGQYVITWYSFQDNTPVNSAQSASGRKLIPYISVAVPFRLLKDFGGKFNYGDKLYLEFLKGRTMPNGMQHTGWVEIDDFCGDNSDDSYCYQTVGGKSYPNTDLYIGDFTKSGMKASSGDCSGPAGNGQELTQVYSGDPGSAWVGNYGGAALGSGKCGDYTSAESQQGGKSGGCWDYTPPTNTVSYCSSCDSTSCSSW